MLKIQTGDTVKILAGKDKGKEGKVEKIFPKKGLVLIPGVNIYKKHVKGQTAEQGQKGGVYEIPRPLPISKVALIDPKTKKTTRVGFKVVSGKKVRISKKSGRTFESKGGKK